MEAKEGTPTIQATVRLEGPPYRDERRTLLGSVDTLIVYDDIALGREVKFTELTPSQMVGVMLGAIRVMAMVLERAVIPAPTKTGVDKAMQALEKCCNELHSVVETKLDKLIVRGNLVGNLVMGFKPAKTEEEDPPDERGPSVDDEQPAPPVFQPAPPKKERKKHVWSPEARARAALRTKARIENKFNQKGRKHSAAASVSVSDERTHRGTDN